AGFAVQPPGTGAEKQNDGLRANRAKTLSKQPKTIEQEVETQSSELHDSQTEEIVIILEEDDGEEPETGIGYTNPDLMAPRIDPGDEECDVIQDHENPLNDIGSNVLNSFRCSECGKRFGSLSYLKLHIRCHTGDRPFRCPVCRKCFSWRGRLQKHMRIHTGEKPFRCSVCGRRFSESGNLKVHMRIHTGEKPFSCTICGKSYAQRGNLNMHMAVHKGDSIIKCSLHQSQQLRHLSHAGANRNFVKRQELAPQEDLKAGPNLRVDESGSGKVHVNCTGCSTCKKPLNCSVCGKRFGFKGQLKAHMRCHTGEKPYKCPICWKCFSWNGCLQKHVKIHTGEKPYECTVCGKGFIESGNLKVHMRIHTGEKPFSCPVCGRRYRQKGGSSWRWICVHRWNRSTSLCAASCEFSGRSCSGRLCHTEGSCMVLHPSRISLLSPKALVSAGLCSTAASCSPSRSRCRHCRRSRVAETLTVCYRSSWKDFCQNRFLNSNPTQVLFLVSNIRCRQCRGQKTLRFFLSYLVPLLPRSLYAPLWDEAVRTEASLRLLQSSSAQD
uniref:C2H2-type domain-containing protein n=1 Tax=Poecilia mexicana TaxID=48701 RepID=A0A3B3XBY4_9TELE